MLVKDCKTEKKVVSFPKPRNFILDIMKEGKKKNIVYASFEVDVTDAFQKIRTFKSSTGHPLSITAYLAWCLSQAVNENKNMHGIRKGKRKIHIFDEVDVAFMIEKSVDGFKQPVNYISRSTNKKSVHQLTEELKKCQNEPVGGEWAMNKIERIFWKQPKWIRNIFWWLSRKFPALRKEFVGTVGITSLGMMGSGKISLFPITPMTLTLAVGTIEEKIKECNGEFVKRKHLNLTLGVDHNLIDGAPLMRFIERLKYFIKAKESTAFSRNYSAQTPIGTSVYSS